MNVQDPTAELPQGAPSAPMEVNGAIKEVAKQLEGSAASRKEEAIIAPAAAANGNASTAATAELEESAGGSL